MNNRCLHPSRFVSVVMETLPSELLLFNPLFIDDVRNNLLHLESMRLDGGTRAARQKFFSSAPTDKSSMGFHEMKTLFESLALWHSPPPEGPDAMNYDKHLRGKFALVTEIYNGEERGPMGSSRHVLLRDFQIKGCGRTLPSWSLLHEEASGVLPLPKALKSFLNAQLGDTILPLGTARPVAVLRPKRNDLRDCGLYIREFRVPRISQVPSLPTSEERTALEEMLQERHPGSSPEERIRRIMFHFAVGAYLGICPIGADNILVDGRLIDEEDWEFDGSWALDLEDSRLNGSTFKHLDENIHQVLQCHQKICTHGVNFLEAKTWFLRALDSLENGLAERWTQFSQLTKKNFDMNDWQETASKAGLTLEQIKVPGEEERSLIKISNPSFNSAPSVWTQVQKLLQIDKKTKGFGDPLELSSSLGKWLGSSSIVLPVKTNPRGEILPNKTPGEEFQKELYQAWPLLKKLPYELLASEKETGINKPANSIASLGRVDLERSGTYQFPVPRTVLD